MPTRVKICGITRIADALAAARAGANAIGLVFCAESPRHVSLAQAREITLVLPPFIAAVGLFVNPAADEVEEVLGDMHLDMLQFHGEESPAFCAQFGVPYLKAVRVKATNNLVQYAQNYAGAKALILDTFVEGMHGGTGKTFDWNLVPQTFPLPIILSGGLAPANVTAAIRQTRPYAVDVSSGVESAKGIKDALKIASFMQGVRNADV